MKLDLDDPRSYGAGGWFIISATREAVGEWDHPANLEATQQLWSRLVSDHCQFRTVTGSYRGTYQGTSFIVREPEVYGRDLAREFGQESILTREGLVTPDGEVLARWNGVVVGDEARGEEFYSVLGGRAFSVLLKWPDTAAEAPQPKGEERQWPEKPAPQYCDDFSCVSFQPEHKLRSYWEQAAADFPADPHELLRYVERVFDGVDAKSLSGSADVETLQTWHKLRRGLEAVAKHRVRE